MYLAPMSCYGLSMQPRPFSLVVASLALAFACGVACGDDGRDDPVVCGDEQDFFEPCASDDNCLSNTCRDGYCTQACEFTDDCSIGDAGVVSCDNGGCSIGCTPANDPMPLKVPCPDEATLMCVRQFAGYGTCKASRSCEVP